MDFQDFLPKNKEKELPIKKSTEKAVKVERISQDQFYEIITGKEASWQAILYELIQTEQLDPWDIDLSILAKRYLEKIRELEDANFFISSKVLLAASLLLRIKSEILLDRYIRSLDDILFGKKQEAKKYEIERIEIDDSEIPILMPKTPLPRFKQVTLQELMSALGKAINTESRRIKREIQDKQAERLSTINIPKTRVNVKDRIRKVYALILTYFKKTPKTRLGFIELVGDSKEAKLAAFLPVLHLDSQQKIFLEQEKHFSEIWIWMYEVFKQKQETVDELEREIEEVEEELELDSEQKRRLEKINKDFENPLANFFDMTSEIMKGEVE